MPSPARNRPPRTIDPVQASAAAPTSGVAGLSEGTIATALAAFYDMLFAFATPQFDRVLDVPLRDKCRVRTAMALRDAHSAIHAVVTGAQNGYREPGVRFSPDQVEALLDIPATDV
jgi:hypothetical protein